MAPRIGRLWLSVFRSEFDVAIMRYSHRANSTGFDDVVTKSLTCSMGVSRSLCDRCELIDGRCRSSDHRCGIRGRYNHAYSACSANKRYPAVLALHPSMSNGEVGWRSPTNDVIFPALTTSVRTGRCVAIIGAGISAADYPVWNDLIGQLQERCGLRAEDLFSTHSLDIAQAAKDKNAPAYFRALDEIFAHRSAPKTAARYHLLARIPFASYISLNFDPLLVDTLDLHRNITVSDYPNLQVQHQGPNEVFCIHGRLGPNRPAANTQIVLTRREFEAAYDPWGMLLHSFIQQTITAQDVCFLGCNPAEPYLGRIFESCKRYCQSQHGLTSPGRPNWYLLADEGYERLETVSECGIHVVQYAKRDSLYSGLDSVLEHWADKKPPLLRVSGVQRSPYDPEVEPDR
jgi:hypothetical protein